MVYTKILDKRKLPHISNIPSPTLILNKWQGYDRFEVENSSSGKKLEPFKTEERLDYLKKIIDYVQTANSSFYQSWFLNYIKTIKLIGAIETDANFQTNWRLLVGWGTNPTLETGIQLHHLYGFPFISGSAVKGMIHHVAELELCENANWKIKQESSEEEISNKLGILQDILLLAELVRILFGSLFILKHENKYGLETPLEWLKIWEKRLADHGQQEELRQRVAKLLSAEHTGGMLTFFDAVPAQDSFNGEPILQTDILNPHYQDYYQDTTNKIPPSDDQNPNPVYFLAVRPGVKFVFPYRIANFPVGEGRDEPEKERAKVLRNFTEHQIKEKVNGWLTKALTEWGAGAKTAAGYGYFIDSEHLTQSAIAAASEPTATNIEDYSEIVAIAPQPFESKIRPETKISGISKQYNQEIWRKISQSEYMKKIEGKDLTAKPVASPLPRFSFEKKENLLKVIYRQGNLHCTVLITLQGIQRKEEAKYIWEHVIKSELEQQ